MPAPTSEKDQKRKEKIYFISIPFSRIFVAIILLAASAITAVVFGTQFMSEDLIANWFFLGGPSLWYPTSFFNTITAIILIIYSILSIKKVVILPGTTILISEEFLILRKFNDKFEFALKPVPNAEDPGKKRKMSTNIPNSVLTVRKIKNIAERSLWILFFGFQIWYLSVDSLAYLTNPFGFGVGIWVGVLYLVHSIIDFLCLAILLLLPEKRFVIYGDLGKDPQLIDLRFHMPPFSKSGKRIINDFEKAITQYNDELRLQTAQKSERQEHTDNISHINNNISNKKGLIGLFSLTGLTGLTGLNGLIGVIFIICAYAFKFFRFYAGDFLAFFIFLTGIFELLESFIDNVAENQSDRNNFPPLGHWDKEPNRIKIILYVTTWILMLATLGNVFFNTQHYSINNLVIELIMQFGISSVLVITGLKLLLRTENGGKKGYK